MVTSIKTRRDGGPEDNAPHILVVDDDKRIRDLLARFLQEHGFRVSTAVDAATARATMRGLSFDLLILDVMMPQESGLDFARSLRTQSHVPILMLTARAEPEQRIEGLETPPDPPHASQDPGTAPRPPTPSGPASGGRRRRHRPPAFRLRSPGVRPPAAPGPGRRLRPPGPAPSLRTAARRRRSDPRAPIPPGACGHPGWLHRLA